MLNARSFLADLARQVDSNIASAGVHPVIVDSVVEAVCAMTERKGPFSLDEIFETVSDAVPEPLYEDFVHVCFLRVFLALQSPQFMDFQSIGIEPVQSYFTFDGQRVGRMSPSYLKAFLMVPLRFEHHQLPAVNVRQLSELFCQIERGEPVRSSITIH